MAMEETTDNGKAETGKETNMPGLMRNYISFVGLAIAAASFTSIALLFLIELSTGTENAYTDLIIFILLPSVMGFGIFVVILGMLIERRRRRGMTNSEIAAYPIIDLNDPKRRRALVVFVCLSFVFLFMSAFGSYRAYEYTESVTFCGEACHDVMKPEFVSFKASSHAEIRCVECHVGSGADAYFQAKFSGMRQLYGVATGHFDRPIKTPVHNMRSATQTCQTCHWSEKYHGEKLRVFNHYGYDENNSLDQTRLSIKVGGGDPKGGPVGGIHWHMNVNNVVEFISTDERRQIIPWVRMRDADGKVTEFEVKDSGLTAAIIEKAEKRKMDCIDCHSRPAHIFLSPNQAVDQALDAGRLSVQMPFIKAKGVEVLSRPYETNDQAVRSISEEIRGYYASSHPQAAGMVEPAVAELQRIYQTYFFPEMKTDWSSHIDNIGHYNAQGCFRCHDGQHVSKEGRVIRNDCSICHTTIDQTRAGNVIRPTNGEFRHPVDLGDKNTWQCAACHKGDSTFKHPLNLGDISQFQCAECHKPQPGQIRY
jgi:nitrate/TMAO reductase-like tetraheme cytochrome c subunit